MADWRWGYDNDASDLVDPGALFTNRMLFYTEASGTILVTVPNDAATHPVYFFTPPNQPGSRIWRAGEVWTQTVVIAVANANINVAAGLFRYDGLGNGIQAYGGVQPEQSCGSIGTRTFTNTTLAQTTVPIPDASHRIRGGLFFRCIAGKGSQQVTIRHGNIIFGRVQVPITMPTARFVYNGINVDFTHPPTFFRAPRRANRDLVISDGGVGATNLRHQFDEIYVEFERFTDPAIEAGLRAFWSWAARGKQYAFMLDTADVVDVALNGSAAAGQAVIPLPNTSGITVGRQYEIREAAGEEFEVITVLSIVANVSVTATTNLVYGYASGDIFRSRGYFPKVISLDSDLPVEEEITGWSLRHRMREDRG